MSTMNPSQHGSLNPRRGRNSEGFTGGGQEQWSCLPDDLWTVVLAELLNGNSAAEEANGRPTWMHPALYSTSSFAHIPREDGRQSLVDVLRFAGTCKAMRRAAKACDRLTEAEFLSGHVRSACWLANSWPKVPMSVVIGADEELLLEKAGLNQDSSRPSEGESPGGYQRTVQTLSRTPSRLTICLNFCSKLSGESSPASVVARMVDMAERTPAAAVLVNLTGTGLGIGSENSNGDNEVAATCHTLGNASKVVGVNLTANHLTGSPTAAGALGSMVASTRSIASLNLGQNGLSTKAEVVQLAKGLRKNSTLCRLKLGPFNNTDQEGARELIDALAASDAPLADLDLWGVNLGPGGLHSLCGLVQQKNTHLRHLRLRETGIGAGNGCPIVDLCSALMSTEPPPAIETLDLRDNRVMSGDDAAKAAQESGALASVLLIPTLRNVVLVQNDINDDHIETLCRRLPEAAVTARLQTLDLGRNSITSDGGAVMAPLVSSCGAPNLRILLDRSADGPAVAGVEKIVCKRRRWGVASMISTGGKPPRRRGGLGRGGRPRGLGRARGLLGG